MKNLLSLLVVCLSIVSAVAANVSYVLSAKTPGLSQAHWWSDWNSGQTASDLYLIKEEGVPSFAYSSARADCDFFFIPMNNVHGGKVLALFPLQTRASYLAVAQEAVYFLDMETGRTIEVPIRTNGETPTLVGPVAMYEGSFTLDGLHIFVSISCTSTPRYPQVQLTWGNGSSPGNPGTDRSVCTEGIATPTRTVKFALEKDTPGLFDALHIGSSHRYWYESEDVFTVKEEGSFSHAYSSIRKERDSFLIPMNNRDGGKVLALSPIQTQNKYAAIIGNVLQFTDLSLGGGTLAVPIEQKGVTISSYNGQVASYEGTFTIDGLRIFVKVSFFAGTSYPQVQLTWGDGASPGDTGSDIDTFTTDPVVNTVLVAVSTSDPGGNDQLVQAGGATRHKFAGVNATLGSGERGLYQRVTFTQGGTVAVSDIENPKIVVDGVSYTPVVEGNRFTAIVGGLLTGKGFARDAYIEGGLKSSAGGKTLRMDVTFALDVSFTGEISGQTFKVYTYPSATRFSNETPWFRGSTFRVEPATVVVPPSAPIPVLTQTTIRFIKETDFMFWQAKNQDGNPILIIVLEDRQLSSKFQIQYSQTGNWWTRVDLEELYVGPSLQVIAFQLKIDGPVSVVVYED